MDPERRYHFPVTGYNFGMTNLAAAVLCAQLERRVEIMGRRRAIFAAYQECLQGVPGVGFQRVAPWAEPAPWMFAITIDPLEYGCSRDELIGRLASRGIETRPMFRPVHESPPFREQSIARGERLPITRELAGMTIMLPTFNGLSERELVRVVEAIAACQREGRDAA
jgi:perosamine synthetase